VKVWVVAALTLMLGFAVAELSGVRALGGVVLVAGAAWVYARAGVVPVIAMAVTFVAAHLIAGAW
jgi:hypothetical protein